MLAGALAALVASFLVCWGMLLSRRSHEKLSIDDTIPGLHKVHRTPVPRIGGFGILAGVITGAAMLERTWTDAGRTEPAPVTVRDAVHAVLRLDPDTAVSMETFWPRFAQLVDVPDSPESRYLYHLMAGHEFQEGLKKAQDTPDPPRRPFDFE